MPANAGSPAAAPCDAARALSERARLSGSTAALTQGSISSQRLSFRPGFLGLGLNGRYESGSGNSTLIGGPGFHSVLSGLRAADRVKFAGIFHMRHIDG
jgi:hypothetical protein